MPRYTIIDTSIYCKYIFAYLPTCLLAYLPTCLLAYLPTCLFALQIITTRPLLAQLNIELMCIMFRHDG